MPTGHYDQHSAMRSVAHHVAKGLKFGENRNQSPNWEDEIGRGVPWFGDTELAYDDDRGVNIAGVIFEWLTDDFTALGWAESLLDEDSFEALRTAGDDFRISPLITEQITAESAFAQLFEYGDIWCRSGPTGKFEIGRWEHGPIDTDSLPIIDSDDLTEEPDLNSNGLDDTVNFVRVGFKDREHYFHDAISEPVFNAGNFRKVGFVRDITLDRPWITDAALANRYAAEYCEFFSRPLISGTLKVKFASIRALGLREGDLFKVDSASLSLEFVFRLIEIELPAARDGVCTLTVENERGIWPELYIQPPAGGPGNFVISPTAIVNKRIWELPSPLKTIPGVQIAVLAQRPSQQIVGFRVFLSVDDETYDPVTTLQSQFAAFGRVVNADYPIGTDVLDLTVGLQVEMFGVDNISSQSDTQRDNNTVLIVVGNEVISEGQVTALGAGKYKVFGRRARYGTVKADHLIGTEVWFIPRDRIGRIANANFTPTAEIFFKLQPFTISQGYDLTLITPFSYIFGDSPFLLGNLELYGQGLDTQFVGRHPRFRWSLFDISGLGVVGVPSSPPAVLNSDTGLWHQVFAGGTGDEVRLRVRVGGTSVAPLTGVPAVYNPDTGLYHELRCKGTGGNVMLQLKLAGSATPPTGGAPIVFNFDAGLYYRIVGKGTDDEVTFRIDVGGGFAVGVGNPIDADQFVRFDLRARDAETGEVVWTGTTVVPEHIYSYEENALSVGGRRRSFIWGPRAVARLADGTLSYTPWLEIEVDNPQSENLGGVVTAAYDRLDIVLNRPTDLDFEGLIVWRSLDPLFEVTIPLADGVELVHDGPELSFSIPQPPGSTYYYRSATYDAFSSGDHIGQPQFLADIVVSDVVPFSTLTLTPTLPPPSVAPGSLNFSGTLNVSIIVPAGAKAVYTEDGTVSQPSSHEWPKLSGVYTTLVVSRSCTLHVRYYMPDGTPSQEMIVAYTLAGSGEPCGTVLIHFSGIHGRTGGTITMACATSGATIRSSVNGAAYTDGSGPFDIEVGETVEAYAIKSGLLDGPHTLFDNTLIGGGGGPPPPQPF